MPATSGRARKQWQIQDGPHGTLRRLRSHLAEDGCVESQVVLAKHLLREAQGPTAPADEELAVQWLLRAADQENGEAIQLLQECAASGRGITDRNCDLVQQSLRIGQEKEKAVQAAKDLYEDLCSQKEGICRTVRRTKHADDDERLSSDSEGSMEMKFVCPDGQTYTEDDVLMAACQAHTCEDPNRSMDKMLEKEVYEQLTLSQKVFKEPLLTLRMSYIFYLESLASLGPHVLHFVLHPSKLHLLLLLFLSWALPFHTAFEFMPVFIFYICLALMIVSTATMVGANKWLHDSRTWKRVLMPTIMTKALPLRDESSFNWKSLWPYCTFFASLLPLLFVYPLAADWVPAAECAVLALMIALPCLAGLAEKYEWVTTTSIGLSFALQLAPRLVLSGPTWAYIGDILPCFGVLPITPHIILHVGIPSLLYLFVPFLFCILAVKSPWQLVYRTLVSHLVCVTWFQLAFVFLLDSTAKGIAWAFLIGLFLLLLLPLATLLACVLLAYVFIWFARAAGALLPLFTWVCLLAAPFLAKRVLAQRLNHSIAWISWVCYSLAAMLFLYFLASLSSHHLRVHPHPSPNISWDVYYNACHQPAWMERTQADVEFGCMQLLGVPVSWDGKVDAVRITQIENKMESVVSLLPVPVQNWARCTFGTPYANCDKKLPACAILKEVRPADCDLNVWRHMTFELILNTENWLEPANFFVLATADFETFVLKLRRGDVVHVEGSLLSNLGGGRPTVELQAIRCVTCAAKNLPAVSVFTDAGFSNRMSRSVHFVIHFFFSPVLEYLDEPLGNVPLK